MTFEQTITDMGILLKKGTYNFQSITKFLNYCVLRNM